MSNTNINTAKLVLDETGIQLICKRLNLKKRIFRICTLCIVWFIWNSVNSGLCLDMLSININFMWVRFMGFNATFYNFHGGQFYWWNKLEYPEKTTDLPHATSH